MVINYFASRGFQCPPTQNVAEFILETASRPSINSDGVRVDWNEEWRNGSNSKVVLEEIDRITAEKRATGSSDKKPTKFAAPTWYQSYLLTKRTFIEYWREPSYVYGRLFVHVVMGLINGFVSDYALFAI